MIFLFNVSLDVQEINIWLHREENSDIAEQFRILLSEFRIFSGNCKTEAKGIATVGENTEMRFAGYSMTTGM